MIMIDQPEIEYVEIVIEKTKFDETVLIGFMSQNSFKMFEDTIKDHPELDGRLFKIQFCDFVVNPKKNILVKCRYDLVSIMRGYCNVNATTN